MFLIKINFHVRIKITNHWSSSGLSLKIGLWNFVGTGMNTGIYLSFFEPERRRKDHSQPENSS